MPVRTKLYVMKTENSNRFDEPADIYLILNHSSKNWQVELVLAVAQLAERIPDTGTGTGYGNIRRNH